MGIFSFFRRNNYTPENNVCDSEAEEDIDFEELEVVNEVLEKIRRKTKSENIQITIGNETTSIFASKIGGLGYIPHDGNFPKDSAGNQLRLLAQIDCSEIDLTDFPEKGLLQFWIANDNCWGLVFADNPVHDTYRVIYYPEVDKSVTRTEIESKMFTNSYEQNDGGGMPVNGEFALEFQRSSDSMSMYDHRYEELFCKEYNKHDPPKKIKSVSDIELDLDDIEQYNMYMECAFNHKIGGYPGFTQTDPREDEDENHDFLLLQLDNDYRDSMDEPIIEWGDSGICNFFISKEKLRRLDFSDVLYNWDCY